MRVLLIAASLGLGLAFPAHGQPAVPEASAEHLALQVGNAAPPLRVATWVKGESIAAFAPGRVYAIEFWATWCGPCVAGIPHLTELQHRFREQADFVGLTAEDQNNTMEMVREFVEAKGDEMDYRVAFDDLGATWRSYMDAAGQNGIPCAFIIDKQSRVAWIGHPADPSFERVLGEIIEDRYDFETARREAEREAAAQRRILEAQAEMHRAWEAGEEDHALALVDEIVSLNPKAMTRWAWWKFQTLMTGVRRPQDAYAYVRTLMEGAYKDNSDMLLQFTYGIADSLGIENPDLDLALELAKRAVELTDGQDHRTLAGLAMVRMRRKEYDEAISVMQRAVDVAPTPAIKAYLANELEFYKLDKEYDSPG